MPRQNHSRQFSLETIKFATNNFDQEKLLGSGGEGKVYKGRIQIDDVDTTVAIKLLTSNSRDRFAEEIKLVSGLHHANLLSLVGYCEESNHKILVYEYLPNGSLAKKLDKTCSLKWMQLLNICLGTARALDYLHRGTSPEYKIIHRDVKPANILLDEKWVAKISDFGLLKRGLSSNPLESDPIKTDLRGTFGYYAPEYVFEREVSSKTDVYAFGVVLLEVLCRKKRQWPLHDESHSDSSRVKEGKEWKEEEIDKWARRNIAFDLRHQISVKCLEKFIDITRRCLLRDPTDRPSMAFVVVMLQESLELQNKKTSLVLYFSSYNSATEKVEKSAEDSLLVRVVLKELLQVNVEEKNVSKYEAYGMELGQKISNDLCLPLIFLEEGCVIDYDMFINLYGRGKLASNLQASQISFICGSCGDKKTCPTCVCSSSFVICKVCDTITMLLKERKLRNCPDCLSGQLYPRTLIRTSQGDVCLYGSSLSCDQYFEGGLGVVEEDTFPTECISLYSHIYHFKLAITVMMFILAFILLYWVQIDWEKSIQSNFLNGNSQLQSAFSHRPDFLRNFSEGFGFCSQLLKPVLDILKVLATIFLQVLLYCSQLVVAIFIFFAVNFFEALLFCIQLLEPLVATLVVVLVGWVKLLFVLVFIYYLVWFSALLLHYIINGIFDVIKQ